MVEIIRFELAKARQRVKRAERSLDRANEQLDDECGGVALSLALCARIRAQQARVIDARERFLKIPPVPHH
ncbi:hypothetical protein DBIPINDM_008148 (plasmid) [Mesorhizobium sp. AR02]|uniref:hypothetical protein n=1 Tax=Mesorhizobium sp. AR02 TaxID=2865837 RepID=UPI00216077F5|nr:hypothetical protein [Mesorhizobium sp. AR02]UVK57553.1 hypothetical protein DBIPINDM_008148 [Mesorhizobium sp. AR02]